MSKRTWEERFWSNVSVGSQEECWEWRGYLYPNGYGRVWSNDGYRSRKPLLVHRVAYELAVGPIPEGLVVDHVRQRGCSRRSCCNPSHLEPVTNRVNLARGDGPALTRERCRRITSCPRGHPYTKENTGINPVGTRYCRECHRAKAKARREKQRVKKDLE